MQQPQIATLNPKSLCNNRQVANYQLKIFLNQLSTKTIKTTTIKTNQC